MFQRGYLQGGFVISIWVTPLALLPWLCFYQTRSAWSRDQGSNKNHSPAYNFAPTVTKFCVMWEGLSLPHDTKFSNCRCKIVDSRSFHSWSLIHGLRWSGLIKVGPGVCKMHYEDQQQLMISLQQSKANEDSLHILCDMLNWWAVTHVMKSMCDKWINARAIYAFMCHVRLIVCCH